jgi:hypothetical protein
MDAEVPLFAGFTGDPFIYRELLEYWTALWSGIVVAADADKLWNAPDPPPDSESDFVGNPILAVRSTTLDRGVRVIQHEIVRGMGTIYAWYNVREHDWWQIPEVELVLNVGLTNVSLPVIRELLVNWTRPSRTQPDFDSEVRPFLIP